MKSDTGIRLFFSRVLTLATGHSKKQPLDYGDISEEIDFSGGERGKFHRDGLHLRALIRGSRTSEAE